MDDQTTPTGQLPETEPKRGSHRRVLSHAVIIKAPVLLPMLYKPSEIAKELDEPECTLTRLACRWCAA